MNAEPRVQRSFRIWRLAGALALFLAVLFADRVLLGLPDREPRSPAVAEIRFEPVALDAGDFEPLRLVGAWALSGDDPRLGGVSAVEVVGGDVVALTDRGAVIRFAKPPRRRVRAEFRDLPAGPGDERFKHNRDSEALLSDPGGRGWWVAFENHNALWLYDPTFGWAIARADLPDAGLGWNTGIEGLASSGADILLLPEYGGRALRLGRSGISDIEFDFAPRRVSAAASFGRGSLLVVERRLTPLGFASALVRLDRCSAGYCLGWRKPLPTGPFDNVEAIATEPLPSGATRLWLMTDDNWSRPLRTLVIAADLPPQT